MKTMTIEELVMHAIDRNQEAYFAMQKIMAYIRASNDHRSLIYEVTDTANQLVSKKSKIVEFNKPSKEGKMPPKYLDGTYRVRGTSFEYRFTHDGKQVSVYGKSKEECWNKRTAIISGKSLEKKKTTIYVNDWLEQWFETYKVGKIRSSSLQTTRHYLDKAILPAFNKRILTSTTALDLQRFLNTFQQTKNKQYKIAIILGEAFRRAYALQKIKANPFLAVDMPKQEKESFKALSFNQQELVLQNISNAKYQAMFNILVCTGMRISEFFALDFDQDINYTDKRIYITKSKGSKTNEINRPKTKAGKRYIPFTEQLVMHIKLFQQFDKLEPTKYNPTQKHFAQIFKKLNLGDGFVIYSFRHTFASVAYHIGISEKQIQSWLGHSHLDITLNIYTELLESGNSFLKEYLINLCNQENIQINRLP